MKIDKLKIKKHFDEVDKMKKDDLFFECEMLRGNINRMCVTDNFEELDRMELVARERIRKIFDYNFKRLSEKEVEE